MTIVNDPINHLPPPKKKKLKLIYLEHKSVDFLNPGNLKIYII